MSFKEAVAKAKAERPEPVLVDVVVGDDLFQVEVTRLPGQEWAGIIATVPAANYLGYDATKAGMAASREYGRLLNADGEAVDMSPEKDSFGKVIHDPWDDLFEVISGTELAAIGATWWALNDRDPNNRVVELKKSLAGGDKTR